MSIIKMTEEELRVAMSDDSGACLACGMWADGCEPDARKRRCSECGEMKVFGMEQLLIMGKIELTE